MKKRKKTNPSISCIKTSLKSILRVEPDTQQYLHNLFSYIQNIHYIARHCTIALKYYYLHSKQFISKDHVEACLYLLSKKDKWNPRGPVNKIETTDDGDHTKKNKKETVDKRTIKDDMFPILKSYISLAKVPNFEIHQNSVNELVSSIFTNITVNIQEHFMQMLHRYINFRTRKKQIEKEINQNSALSESERKTVLAEFWSRLRLFKSWATFDTIPTPEQVDKCTDLELDILNDMFNIIPTSQIHSEDDLAFNLVKDPSLFFHSYWKLAELYDKYEIPLFNALPLRRSFIQSSVFLDTHVFYSKILGMTRTAAEKEADMKMLWDKLFRTSSKVFSGRRHRNLEFSGTIYTDGMSASIKFEDLAKKRYGKKTFKPSLKQIMEKKKKTYFENNLNVVRTAPNIVCIDPNKRDLLYCLDSYGNRFRYTANQRDVESRSRFYNQYRTQMKQEAQIDILESEIPTHKTTNFQKFMHYIKYVTDNEQKLREFYLQQWHSKLRWKTKINKQRSEGRLVSNMKQLFGKKAVYILGDWSDGGHTLKNQKSTKNRGFLTLFERNKMKRFLLDEYRTSTTCPDCEQDVVKNLKKRLSPKPWKRKEGIYETVHGLLGCNNLTCKKQDWTCKYWNRDMLSVRNYHRIVESVCLYGVRPKSLSRSRSQSQNQTESNPPS